MKTILSLALAGAIAATSLATTTVTADAGHKSWHNNHHHKSYRHHRPSRGGWNPGAAFATGAILGLGVGVLATPSYAYPPPPPPVAYYPPPPAPYYGGGPYAQHVSWCSARYRSYNASTNTWVGYDGYVRQCASPYN